MTALEVLRCGPGASVQDAGRVGYRRFGVSTAGAMDRRALAVANALVGNTAETAALEMPLAGASFRVRDGEVLAAVCGPGATLSVDGRKVPPATSAKAREGETVEVGAARDGVYAYLAVAGGIALPPVLGSRSGHRRTGIGPQALSVGDRVPCVSDAGGRPALRFRDAPGAGSGPVRVVPGPQDDAFDADAWTALLSEPFAIGPQSDRMGLRLDGPRLTAATGHDIVSEGVATGSIQVPADGRPIVLGRDCQTTGGYPKIATVISTDFDMLAQVPPGGTIRFQKVSLDAAIAAARRAAEWRATLDAALEPADALPRNLLIYNLVDGVTDGTEG